MRERETYLTKEDDIWFDKELVNKLNAQILLDTGKIDIDIKKAGNDLRKQVTRLKVGTIQADKEYMDAMDEIDKLKEKLRQ